MSSMQRGATGAGRPKPVNVNNLYSGRNLAAGAKPIGKHGLQSVGKSVGVVRRMPPPATLPSIKSENNGQDPTTVIVPQGGSGGWLKADAAPIEPVKTVPVAPSSSGPDLRPTWAKPPNAEPVTAPTTTASNREFPTLASSGGKEVNKNVWNNAASQNVNENATSTHEDERQLPSRYYDNGSKTGSGSYRSRFQGSNDARASQPAFGQRSIDGERNRVDSIGDSTGSGYAVDSKTNGSEGFFESASATPAPVESAALVVTKSPTTDAPVPIQERAVSDVDRESANDKNRQQKSNYRESNDEPQSTPSEIAQRRVQPPPAAPAPQPEYRLLKRPQRIELEDISDDDQEVQMTKLNKPAVRVIKRVPVGEEEQLKMDTASSPQASAPVDQQSNRRRNDYVSNKSTYDTSRQDDNRRSAGGPKVKEREQHQQTYSRREPAPAAVEAEAPTELQSDKVEEVVPAPPPAENIWAKRKEERESQEKDKKSCVPKAMQQAIEQHFPAVNETAALKLKKDVARRPAETEFTRAAMRAQRAPACNDVRQMIPRGGPDSERRGPNRESIDESDRSYSNGHMREQRNDRYHREPREYDDYGGSRYGGNDYRGGDRESYLPEGARSYNREERRGSAEYDREEYNGASREYSRGARRGVVSRGRSLRGFGRGRGGAYNVRPHQPGPVYQLQRRGDSDTRETLHENDDVENHTDSNTIGDDEVVPEADRRVTEKMETSMKAIDLNGSGAGDEPTEIPAKYDRHSYPSSSSRGRWQRGGPISRGRGEVRRGGRGSMHSRGYDVPQEPRGPRRGPRIADENESEEAGHPQSYRTRGGSSSYSQQRVRRGQKEHKPPRISHTRRGSDDRSSQGQDRAERLKSPVASSEGHDEWETASESSGRARRDDRDEPRGSTPSQRVNTQSQAATTQDSESTTVPAERVRSKNGQPARRTCRSPLEGGNSSSKNNKSKQSKVAAGAHQTRCHSADKVADSDGLAGVDINNFSNVVVVDDYLQETISPDALHEFEEVMTKSAKRQREKEEQQRMEAEERRREKERERLERIQAKKAAAAAERAAAKKRGQDARNEGRKERNETVSNAQSAPSRQTQATTVKVNVVRKEVPVTTVWNSANVGAVAMEKEKLKEQEVLKQPVIPSPIARPTPRSKSAASDSPPAVREEPLRMVELPVSLSLSQPLRGGEKYDFTFDASMHEAQLRETTEKTATALSTGANSESGSVADDFRLKEKLNRVKDLWSGSAELEKQSEPLPLPSNVAKVKPQPQGGETPASEDPKTQAPSTSSVPSASRSPSMSAFAGNSFTSLTSPFPNSYMMMSDMHAYSGSSLLPPPNATSPPTMPHGQFVVPSQAPVHRGGHGPRNPPFMESGSGFVNRNQSNMTWAPNSVLDGVMPFGNATQSPNQQQFAQFANVQQQSRVVGAHHSPSQMVHHQSNVHHQQQPPPHRFGGSGGPPTQQQQPPPHTSHHGKLAGAPGGGSLMTFPMEVMGGMSVPPPMPPQHPSQHHHHNMNTSMHQQHGAVGSHRNGAYSTMMGGSFHQPPPSQFTQPPPTPVNIRFTQPPPPIGGQQDMTWAKIMPGQQQQQASQFASGGIYRGPTQHPMMRNGNGGGGGAGGPPHPPDVWSSSMNPNQTTSMHSFVPHNQRHHLQHGGLSNSKASNGSSGPVRSGLTASGDSADLPAHKGQTAGGGDSAA